MSELETLVTRTGLLAWHDAGDVSGVVHGGGVATVPDKSGNGRDLTCASSRPTLALNAINGHPAINWNGSQNPLKYTGPMLVKHAFIVASYADATFAADYAGLLSDLTTIVILLGDATTTKFYDNTYGSIFEYRRRDLLFLENNQQAEMSGAFSIYEVRNTTGFSLDGLQVGQDRNQIDRKWSGRVPEDLAYGRILNDAETLDIYQYFALKYLLWRTTAAGLYVWPFEPEWGGRRLAVDKSVLTSVAVSGAFKSRSKGSKKLLVSPQFESRWPEEWDAAVEFWDDHNPGANFIYRDGAFSPARDSEMRFTIAPAQTGNDFRDISYTFEALEV